MNTAQMSFQCYGSESGSTSSLADLDCLKPATIAQTVGFWVTHHNVYRVNYARKEFMISHRRVVSRVSITSA